MRISDWSSDVCSSDLLGLNKSNIADIQKLPWQQILEAQTAAGGNFSPVIGTDALPNHPFDPAAPAVSAHVPIIVSTRSEAHRVGNESVRVDLGVRRNLQKQTTQNHQKTPHNP